MGGVIGSQSFIDQFNDPNVTDASISVQTKSDIYYSHFKLD